MNSIVVFIQKLSQRKYLQLTDEVKFSLLTAKRVFRGKTKQQELPHLGEILF